MSKRIHLFGLKQSTVGHTAIGLFIANALGVLDVYGGSADEALRHGIQTPTDDPLLVVSAMAAAATRLGFAVTVSTSYEHPYALARKMTTLDHLSEGRIGWNIVTSALDSAARNLGLTKQVPHDERYSIAEEFMEVVRIGDPFNTRMASDSLGPSKCVAATAFTGAPAAMANISGAAAEPRKSIAPAASASSAGAVAGNSAHWTW